MLSDKKNIFLGIFESKTHKHIGNIKFEKIDCCDFQKVKKVMKDVEVVYHCAATAHEGLSVFSPFEIIAFIKSSIHLTPAQRPLPSPKILLTLNTPDEYQPCFLLNDTKFLEYKKFSSFGLVIGISSI